MLRTVAVLAALATTVACEAAQFGVPRFALEVVSPRGDARAFVRNHPALDPPNQSLWLERAGQTAIKLGDLPPDMFWCDQIIWSADGTRVAFVIANAIVQVFDVDSSRRIYSGFVGTRSWDTPPRFVLQAAALSHDGSALTFRECERKWRPVETSRQNRRGTRVDSRTENCSEQQKTVVLASLGQATAWP